MARKTKPSDKDVDRLLVDKVDKRRERIKDVSDYAAQEATVSLQTRKILSNLMNKGIITKFQGIFSSGKEANVYNGNGEGGREIAIKIYRINAQTSKWMMDYIHGDPRFATFRKKNTRGLMTTWAQKEFKNLKRAREAGVPVPEPLAVVENVLVMEFIGKGGTPGRRIVDLDLDKLGDPLKHLNAILQGIQDLFIKARLIHGDLSPYNLLYFNQKVYFIDFAQAVLMDHPNARKYFDRDIDNVLGYFTPLLAENFNRNALANSIMAGKFVKIG
nr:serine protein kinase RIO [Candidatus Sigynarchaeota archaeon]